MDNKPTVCLLNDSFPPHLDGVANVVVNYARQMRGFEPVVITPANPEADDSGYDFPVVRYPSIQTQRFEGYPAGIPFSPEVARNVDRRDVAILHSHCPIISTFMARQLRQITDAPIVFTYHTKFDVDIQNVIRPKPLQQAAKKALAANISACDEVWVVSRGAGENLSALGYEGDYIVMPNGVDLPRERVSDDLIREAAAGYDLPEGVPVYLFVGRMMWYKGLRTIIDALAMLNAQRKDYRMVFVGAGEDMDEIRQYAGICGVLPKCIFAGTIHDRSSLRGWYGRADLFLFPSTFDTNGLVVREAAACGLASVLVEGSCAAEGVSDGHNGFLIDQSAASLAACVSSLTAEHMAAVGAVAGDELYISWETAVKYAVDRYGCVIDSFKSGRRPRRPMEELMKINGELMDALAKLSALRHND